MAWSPNYKQNRFAALKGMKIKDRCDYNRLRKYYATLNGHVAGRNHEAEKNVVRKSLFNGSRFNVMSFSRRQPISTSVKVPDVNKSRVVNVPGKAVLDKQRMQSAAARASVMSAISQNMTGG